MEMGCREGRVGIGKDWRAGWGRLRQNGVECVRGGSVNEESDGGGKKEKN